MRVPIMELDLSTCTCKACPTVSEMTINDSSLTEQRRETILRLWKAGKKAPDIAEFTYPGRTPQQEHNELGKQYTHDPATGDKTSYGYAIDRYKRWCHFVDRCIAEAIEAEETESNNNKSKANKANKMANAKVSQTANGRI